MTTTNEPATTVLSAQVPTMLRDELRLLARERDRSVSAEVRSALRLHLRTVRESGGLGDLPSTRPVPSAGEADREPA